MYIEMLLFPSSLVEAMLNRDTINKGRCSFQLHDVSKGQVLIMCYGSLIISVLINANIVAEINEETKPPLAAVIVKEL